MVTIILALFSVIGILYVLYPIFAGSDKKDIISKEKKSEKNIALNEHKRIIFTLLKDLEFEYETGKVSESDYNKLREEYKNKVILVYQEMDK